MTNDRRTSEQQARLIRDTIEDMVTDFLYYDRQEDEDLPCGAIEAAIKDGAISCDEIVNEFRLHLLRSIQP
jgi:cytochrome P450